VHATLRHSARRCLPQHPQASHEREAGIESGQTGQLPSQSTNKHTKKKGKKKKILRGGLGGRGALVSQQQAGSRQQGGLTLAGGGPQVVRRVAQHPLLLLLLEEGQRHAAVHGRLERRLGHHLRLREAVSPSSLENLHVS
jgi:hypothetical protein